ncbi:MAG TPA: branched-chain amino acid ABC transporter permease [Burkholderiaceae bacterium]|nr:branched-chain amino acid ABC transporter permease [Burkholderiaceae bacterium]
MATTTHSTIRFAPYNVGRWLLWGFTALVFILAPVVFSGGFAITLLSQMGIMIIFALSYNMIFGQGGMLSFGHAVFSGLGAYFAIHALNWVGDGRLWVPVTLIPLVGGLFGAVFGVIFGYLITKKAGTTFAMITLGIGEMVFAASLMFPGFFGGEGGISSNRVVGEPFFGITYGPTIQVYYLIAAWCFVCMIAMFAFSQTPLGRISNAVRDNPERAEFIGYNTQRVRFLVVVVSAFFAGISGGLAAINFEIVTAENVSALRSGGVLLATFIGGSMVFFGPVIGSIIFIFFAVALSEYTNAWQFYLGVFFILMVMYAPGGVASLVLMNLRVVQHKLFGRLLRPYVGVLLASALMLVGLIMLVEMSYHMTLNFAAGARMSLFGIEFEANRWSAWAVALLVTLAGAAAFDWQRRRFSREWGDVQALIETGGQRARV